MTREEAIELIETVAKEVGVNVTIEEKQNKKYEFKDGDKYFYISQFGDAQPSEWNNSNVDKFRFDFGNIYMNREDAEKVSLNIRIMSKLRMFAEEVNEGWEPNWQDGTEFKWFLIFDHCNQKWDTVYRTTYEYLYNIYFKSEELAKRAVEEVIIPILEGAKEKE